MSLIRRFFVNLYMDVKGMVLLINNVNLDSPSSLDLILTWELDASPLRLDAVLILSHLVLQLDLTMVV